MKVLIACEYSGVVRDAFLKLGHEALSCDLLPTDAPGPHYEGSLFDVIDYPWDFGGFHFPCTDLSVSGARHFETKATCLWLWGVDSLKPTFKTIDECREALGLPVGSMPEARIHKMPPGPNRWKERSKTYQGIADAMANQWGGSGKV